jgi:hypothetical protein
MLVHSAPTTFHNVDVDEFTLIIVNFINKPLTNMHQSSLSRY